MATPPKKEDTPVSVKLSEAVYWVSEESVSYFGTRKIEAGKGEIMKRPLYYKMNPDGTTEPCSMEEMARSYKERKKGIIIHTNIWPGVLVSTIFLVIDHSFGLDPAAPPILFETMIFGTAAGRYNEYQERYCTVEEARAGHLRTIKRARRGMVKKYTAIDIFLLTFEWLGGWMVSSLYEPMPGAP